jgi:hypothetical protein
LIALSESSAMAAGLFILPPVKAQLRCQVDIESNHKKDSAVMAIQRRAL